MSPPLPQEGERLVSMETEYGQWQGLTEREWGESERERGNLMNR